MFTITLLMISIIGGITTVSLAGLSYSKWLIEHDDDVTFVPDEYAGVARISAMGAQERCPFCGVTIKHVFDYDMFEQCLPDESLWMKLQDKARAVKACGPTKGKAVKVDGKFYLLQGCIACQGRWLTHTSTSFYPG